MAKSFDEIINEVSLLHIERNGVYKDNYKKFGAIMMAIFPDGITLDSPEDFGRFSLFNEIIKKMQRYSISFHKGGHQDSIRDAGVYAHMLEEVDSEVECAYCEPTAAKLVNCRNREDCKYVKSKQ